MVSNSLKALMALTMLASSGNLFDSDPRPTPIFKPRHNERKKCFRKDCTNNRIADSLYCSSECKEIYHKFLKEKELESKLRK